MKKLVLSLVLMSTMSNVVWAAKPQHIGTQLNTEAVRLIIKSGLDLMNGGKEDSVVNFPSGAVYQKLTYDNPQFDNLFGVVNELFGVDVHQGLPLYVYYSTGTVQATVLPNEFKFSVKKISDEKFQIDINGLVRDLSASLPALNFCTNSGCKGGNYVKFRKIGLATAATSQPIDLKASLEVTLTPVTSKVNGKTVTSKIAQLKVLSTSSNLSTKGGPKVVLSYFKGLYKGQEWPVISALQIGPANLGLSITSADLIRELDLYKNQLGSMIVKKAAEFITNDLAKFVNEVLQDKKFSPEYWGSYQYVAPFKLDARVQMEEDDRPDPIFTPHVMERDNTYVAPRMDPIEEPESAWSYFSTLIKNVKYGILLSDVNVKSTYPNQFFNVLFDTDITINKESLKPIATRGHGACSSIYSQYPVATPTPVPTAATTYQIPTPAPMERDNTYVAPTRVIVPITPSLNCLSPLQPIAFKKSSNGKSNIAVAFSESYVNSLLMMMHKQGILQKMMNKLAYMKGVYLGADGVKVHISKSPGTNSYHLYLILNLFVKLEEQDWVNRNIGGPIEALFGSTGGHFKFPLEIPVGLTLKQVDGKYKIGIKAGSPFIGNDLTNYHQYTNNLNYTADTWFISLKKKVLNKVKEGLADSLDPSATKFLGRTALKMDDLDISEYLESMPVDFTPVEISLESTGHAVLYGKMNKLDLSKITVKGSN